jgi:hypothetical protein
MKIQFSSRIQGNPGGKPVIIDRATDRQNKRRARREAALKFGRFPRNAVSVNCPRPGTTEISRTRRFRAPGTRLPMRIENPISLDPRRLQFIRSQLSAHFDEMAEIIACA